MLPAPVASHCTHGHDPPHGLLSCSFHNTHPVFKAARTTIDDLVMRDLTDLGYDLKVRTARRGSTCLRGCSRRV